MNFAYRLKACASLRSRTIGVQSLTIATINGGQCEHFVILSAIVAAAAVFSLIKPIFNLASNLINFITVTTEFARIPRNTFLISIELQPHCSGVLRTCKTTGTQIAMTKWGASGEAVPNWRLVWGIVVGTYQVLSRQLVNNIVTLSFPAPGWDGEFIRIIWIVLREFSSSSEFLGFPPSLQPHLATHIPNPQKNC